MGARLLQRASRGRRQQHTSPATRLQASSSSSQGSRGSAAAAASTHVHLGLTSPTPRTGAGAAPTPSEESGAATLRAALKENAQPLADMFKAIGEEGGGRQLNRSEFRKAIPLIGVKASRAQI